MIIENAKAMSNRHIRCTNEEKMSCCYLCTLRSNCIISCKYLGNPDVTYVPVGPENMLREVVIDEPKELPESQLIDQAKYCLSCKVEMSETTTELRVDRWKGFRPNMPSADMLPVMVYLCPRCGKIEFRADRK